MGFYDNEVWDSWGGTGDPTPERIKEAFPSYSAMIDFMAENYGLKNETIEDKLWILFLVSTKDINFTERDHRLAVIRKDKSDSRLKIFSLEGFYHSNDRIHLEIQNISYTEGKAFGVTYKQTHPWKSWVRKEWTYECPLKYLYWQPRRYYNHNFDSLYINFTGTEVLVEETNGTFKKFRTTPKETLEWLITTRRVANALEDKESLLKDSDNIENNNKYRKDR